MKTLINKALLIIICYLCYTNSAQATIYQISQSNGTVEFTVDNWDDPLLWTRIGGGSGYPINGDEVQFGNPVGGSLGGISIGSDLDLTGITFTATEWGSVLNVSGSISDAIINENDQQLLLTVNSDASLETLNDFTYEAYGSTLNVYGDVTINGSLNFLGGATQYLNSSGTLTVTESFTMEGSVLNITSGNVIIEEDWVIPSNSANGINSLIVESGASMIIKGDLDLYNGNLVGSSDVAFLDIEDQIDIKEGGSFFGKCPNTGTDGDGSICNTINESYHDESLPVTLLAFNGEKVDDAFLLTWKTASEHNSDRFDVEASNDKRYWEVIVSKPAAGNSDVELEYTYLNEKRQFQYYRLAQYDLDGSVEYFGVVYSDLQSSQINISVFPSLLEKGEELKVFFSGVSEGSKVKLRFMDLQGVVLINEDFNDISDSRNFVKVKVPNQINNGIYILNLSVNGKVFRNKLLIK